MEINWFIQVGRDAVSSLAIHCMTYKLIFNKNVENILGNNFGNYESPEDSV